MVFLDFTLHFKTVLLLQSVDISSRLKDVSSQVRQNPHLN